MSCLVDMAPYGHTLAPPDIWLRMHAFPGVREEITTDTAPPEDIRRNGPTRPGDIQVHAFWYILRVRRGLGERDREGGTTQRQGDLGKCLTGRQRTHNLSITWDMGPRHCNVVWGTHADDSGAHIGSVLLTGQDVAEYRCLSLARFVPMPTLIPAPCILAWDGRKRVLISAVHCSVHSSRPDRAVLGRDCDRVLHVLVTTRSHGPRNVKEVG